MFLCRCCKYQPVSIDQPPCKIPLKNISFNSIVQNSLVNLSILQTFKNEETKPIECEYMFKVPDDSVITNLRIHLADGTILNAKIEPTEKAAEIYQDSIAEGNTVAHGKLEEEQMTILLGNLAPNDSIQVEFNLTFPLSTDESSWKLSIPAGFLPTSDFNNLLSFDFTVQILSQSAITSFTSNCSLDFQLSPDCLMLQGILQQNKYKTFTDKNLWVKFKSSDTNTPTCIMQNIGSKYVGMLSFIPFSTTVESLDDLEGQGEYIFVLDRSGSMQGSRIEMAKQAAVLFLNSLPTGSLFNIVSFGNNSNFMFAKSEPNISNFVKSAIDKVMSFGADMGGTNIFKPLSQIFCEMTKRELPRTVFLLTDGQVSNPEQVIEIIRMNSASCRVHGFGIGDDVDASLIKGAAKAGKGCASFITRTEDIGKNVISALQKCIYPCVSEWGIDWAGECYPNTQKIGSLYYGERCIQYILFDEKPTQAVNLKFFDNFSKEFKEHSISNFHEVPGDSLFKLWINSKLEWLSEDLTQNEGQIIQLSLESGIPSKLTSFVCIKENDEPVTEEMISKKIQPQIRFPIAYNVYLKSPSNQKRSIKRKCINSRGSRSRGSDMLDRSRNVMPSCLGPDMLYYSMPASINSPKKRKRKGKLDCAENNLGGVDDDECVLESCEEKIDSMADAGQNNRLYFDLVSKIETEGFWAYEELSKILPTIKKVPDELVDCVDKKNVICTLFILAFMHRNFQSKFDEWVLVERKALKWLRLKGISFKDLQETLNSYL